jgi:hypothetical protein
MQHKGLHTGSQTTENGTQVTEVLKGAHASTKEHRAKATPETAKLKTDERALLRKPQNSLELSQLLFPPSSALLAITGSSPVQLHAACLHVGVDAAPCS